MKLRISSKVWFYVFLFVAILSLFLYFQLVPATQEGAANRNKKMRQERKEKKMGTYHTPTVASKPTMKK